MHIAQPMVSWTDLVTSRTHGCFPFLLSISDHTSISHYHSFIFSIHYNMKLNVEAHKLSNKCRTCRWERSKPAPPPSHTLNIWVPSDDFAVQYIYRQLIEYYNYFEVFVTWVVGNDVLHTSWHLCHTGPKFCLRVDRLYWWQLTNCFIGRVIVLVIVNNLADTYWIRFYITISVSHSCILFQTGTIRTPECTKNWSAYSHSAILDIRQTEPQAWPWPAP